MLDVVAGLCELLLEPRKLALLRCEVPFGRAQRGLETMAISGEPGARILDPAAFGGRLSLPAACIGELIVRRLRAWLRLVCLLLRPQLRWRRRHLLGWKRRSRRGE